jgi:predicted nucleic acid-binding protein
MMGRQPPLQAQLFYVGFNLDRRVRADHPLRTIAATARAHAMPLATHDAAIRRSRAAKLWKP